MYIKVKKLRDEAQLPVFANEDWTNAGMDVYAAEGIWLTAGEVTKVPTGIAIEIRAATGNSSMLTKQFMKLESRSGLASKGIVVVGGVLDLGYRGEVVVLLRNTTKEDYYIAKHDRIAQGIVHEIPFISAIVEADELEDSERGESGFGSSGF